MANDRETAERRIKEIRARLDGTTRGPWRRSGTAKKPHWFVASESENVLVHGTLLERLDHVQATIDRWIADADFIAHAREDIPFLLSLLAPDSQQPEPTSSSELCAKCGLRRDREIHAPGYSCEFQASGRFAEPEPSAVSDEAAKPNRDVTGKPKPGEWVVRLPSDLHENAQRLVTRFAEALASKLAAAQVKYGYGRDWEKNDWMDECRVKLRAHVEKGDPRDVAAYCAFLWFHGEKTSAARVRNGGAKT